MNDQILLERVARADPLCVEIGEPPDALFERVLATARAETQSPASAAQLRRGQRGPLSRWTVASAAAAVVLAAVLVAALLPAGDTGAPSSAAAAVLLHAARIAAKQPATPPAPGQFVYQKSEGLSGTTTIMRGREFNTVWRYTRQQWIAPDGSGRILQVAGKPRLATSADRAVWIADGRPDLDDGSGNIHITQGRQPRAGYSVLLSHAPTDPGALEKLIVQRKLESAPPGNAQTFAIIGDLLRGDIPIDPYASPAVRAALYTVAARLPGVRLIGATHDQLGRAGTAVGYGSNGILNELIFDPRTSALLAEQTIDKGTVVAWTAYLASGIVNSTSDTTSGTP